MTKTPQYVLNRDKVTRLKEILHTMQEDIAFIEKAIGAILIKADAEKSQPLIDFGHNALQSLRLIPIYARNIEKMITPETTGDLTAYAEKTNTLIHGLLSITEQSFSTDQTNDPENLNLIITELVSREDYLQLGSKAEVIKIRIVAIKLSQTFLVLKDLLS